MGMIEKRSNGFEEMLGETSVTEMQKKKDEKMDEIFKNHGTIIRCATYVNKSKEEKEEKL